VSNPIQTYINWITKLYKPSTSLEESIDIHCIENGAIAFEPIVDKERNIHFYLHILMYNKLYSLHFGVNVMPITIIISYDLIFMDRYYWIYYYPDL